MMRHTTIPPRGRRHGGQGGAEPRARIASRAEEVLRLTIHGCSQRHVAKQLQISQPAVSKILRRLADEHAKANKSAFEQHVFIAEQKYRTVYQKALEGFDRSQQPRTRRTQRHASGDPKGAVAAEIQVVDSAGDPRYLEQARKALEGLERTQGLTAVLRTGRPGLMVQPAGPLRIAPIVEILREKLHKQAAVHQQQQAEKAAAAARQAGGDPPPAPGADPTPTSR